ALGEMAVPAQMLLGESVEEQRTRWTWETRIVRVAFGCRHFIGLVQIVQPGAIDEAVLHANRRDASPARLEHDRAAPAAGLGIGDDGGGFSGGERPNRFL